MRPIGALSVEEAQALRGVCFDLDDTLLDHGRLLEETYAALFRLVEAGLTLYGVTGRPAGWGEVLARLFPVKAIVTENGAVTCALEGKRVVVRDSVDAATRRERDERLRELLARFRERFPDFECPCETNGNLPIMTIEVAADGENSFTIELPEKSPTGRRRRTMSEDDLDDIRSKD